MKLIKPLNSYILMTFNHISFSYRFTENNPKQQMKIMNLLLEKNYLTVLQGLT